MHRRARARCLSGGASCATLRVITGTCIYALMYLLAAIVAEQCNTSDAWQGCKAPCHPRSGCVAGCRPGAAGRCGGARSQLPARAGARAAALTLLRGAAALHHGMSPGPDAHSAGGSAPAEWCWVLPFLNHLNNNRERYSTMQALHVLPDASGQHRSPVLGTHLPQCRARFRPDTPPPPAGRSVTLLYVQEPSAPDELHAATERWLQEQPRAGRDTLAALAAAAASMCAAGQCLACVMHVFPPCGTASRQACHWKDALLAALVLLICMGPKRLIAASSRSLCCMSSLQRAAALSSSMLHAFAAIPWTYACAQAHAAHADKSQATGRVANDSTVLRRAGPWTRTERTSPRTQRRSALRPARPSACANTSARARQWLPRSALRPPATRRTRAMCRCGLRAVACLACGSNLTAHLK